MTIRVAVLTISDRSARGERPDLSGPALSALIQGQGWQLTQYGVIPDDFEIIRDTLIEYCDRDLADILLTTGGTGFAPRDVTPEATLAAMEKNAPGLAEAMRLESLKVTPHAMLSRAAAGIRGRTLVINLPGSPKAAVENLAVIIPVLPHAVELLRDNPDAEQGHNAAQPRKTG
ncbi:MAG TPA: MogA/MoaB family molybdenum cofactor biosynthesis protein [Anaerolineaceae bacterium]